MVKVKNGNMDWVGMLAAIFGAAVVVPSVLALLIAVGAVVIELF